MLRTVDWAKPNSRGKRCTINVQINQRLLQPWDSGSECYRDQLPFPDTLNCPQQRPGRTEDGIWIRGSNLPVLALPLGTHSASTEYRRKRKGRETQSELAE